MNKINISLPIIKINVDYSIRSKEKSGLFEYTILDIYQNFNNSEFQNYTFKDFIHKILQAKVPDLFIEKALEYLDNYKILTSEYEDGLIDLPISSFAVSNKNSLKTMLENKELYSQSQIKNIDLYYDPLTNQIVNVNSDQLIKDIDKPVVNGDKFKHMNVKDSTKSTFIEFIKKKESSFFKDGAKIDDIKEQFIDDISEKKREVLYRNMEVEFTLRCVAQNEYKIVFNKRFEYLERYTDKFISYVFSNDKIFENDKNNNLIQYTLNNIDCENGIIVTNLSDIEKYMKGKIYLVLDSDENKMDQNEDYLKVYLKQSFNSQKSFLINDEIYSHQEIKINDISKKVFIHSVHIQETYNKITHQFTKHFISVLFKNIKEVTFYKDIQQLKYLINSQIKTEVYMDELITQLIKLDIYLFINRIVSIIDLLSEDEEALKYFNENIFSRYLEVSKLSQDKLNSFFNDWKYHTGTMDKVKEVQNKLLESIRKSDSVYVLDTNILINLGEDAFKRENLILSAAVIEELDDVKKRQPDTLQTIKKVQKYLNKSNRDDIVYENSEESIKLLPPEFREEKRDNMILALCLKDKEKRVLVTNDQNLQLKAKAMSIKSINSGIFLQGVNK